MRGGKESVWERMAKVKRERFSPLTFHYYLLAMGKGTNHSSMHVLVYPCSEFVPSR